MYTYMLQPSHVAFSSLMYTCMSDSQSEPSHVMSKLWDMCTVQSLHYKRLQTNMSFWIWLAAHTNTRLNIYIQKKCMHAWRGHPQVRTFWSSSWFSYRNAVLTHECKNYVKDDIFCFDYRYGFFELCQEDGTHTYTQTQKYIHTYTYTQIQRIASKNSHLIAKE
jgi:hypothetical protein